MSIFELLILAIGLSMDSFAVSVTSGVVLKPFRISSALKIASFLALFQGAMPLIGWFIGREFQKYIQDYFTIKIKTNFTLSPYSYIRSIK